MTALLCALSLILSVTATRTNFETDLESYSYADFCTDFGKVYDEGRAATFNANKALIIKHNSEQHSWTMAVNKFADMTKEEFKNHYRGYSPALRASKPRVLDANMPAPAGPLPPSVDWRTKGVVSPVKDQGSCGSCWAFATTQTVESYVALKTGKAPPILSTQDVVSCAPNPNHCGGDGGCAGATAEVGLTYIATAGQALEKDYPYRAVTGSCQSKPRTKYISGWKDLPTNNYTALVYGLAEIGPMAVSVDAGSWSFYSGGIFNGCSLNDIDLDHAVQAVGYGTENGKDYWIVRNSWGSGWGERGFIRLLKHSDGDMKWCGIDKKPNDGTGCKDGPPQVTVCGTCGIWYDNTYAIPL
jgi:cathepsin L